MISILLQIAAYSKHIANIAATAISSRQLLISLEAEMTEKETLILTLEDSVKTKDEKIRLSLEKDAQSSSKLGATETKIAELEAALKKKDEEAANFKAIVEKKTNERKYYLTKLNIRVSAIHRRSYRLIQKSKEYQAEFFNKACSYYDRGVAHVLR